jgi:protein TonB
VSRRILLSFYVLSFVGHASAAVVMSRIERAPAPPERYEVFVQDPATPEEVEPPPPPPPIEVPVAETVPRTRSTERAVAADPVADAPAPTDGAPPPPMAFGVVLGNTGPGGIAVAVGDPGGVVGGTGTTRTRVRAAQDLVAAAPAPAGSEAEACGGETSRPRPVSMAHPRYTDAARAAAIEGRVRVRLEVDATGAVTNATVISPLGHGLDDAAVQAALASRFEPALECGRAVAASFVVSIRFTL